MNDYDYETVWDYEVSCHDSSYLEEETGYHGSYIDDEMDYERSDSTDYQNLAYIHFAQCQLTKLHTSLTSGVFFGVQ